ncbi:family 43 glycosylhydrolase [Demequina sp. NBRC 110051]|uniref:family 43 glycosylhydrolase n=1 Tax=Demequina sp. NBRC 110051 TaxID=1570340 RepID=UPI000A059C43|nr:family 43 glycosylhydrolase [Demequina sp. NBRC 110051]
MPDYNDVENAVATATLTVYDREPASEAEANNADIALSVHLALDGEPLFDNYGVAFAHVSETPGPDGTFDPVLRGLIDPHVVALADGGYGIVATRTARGGGDDGTRASSVLLLRSDDLIDYTELGLLDLGVTHGVNAPAVVADGDGYVMRWSTDAGEPWHATLDLFAPHTALGEPTPGDHPIPGEIVAGDAAASGIPDLRSGNAIEIPADLAARLRERFGPVANTDASVAPVAVPVGAALTVADLPARVDLAYSDGSTGSLAVTWDNEALSAIDTSVLGEHAVTGTVRQPIYPTPFADERADPSIVPFHFNGRDVFLMIATKDLNLDPIANDGGPIGMPIRMADTIAALADPAGGDGLECDILVAGDLDAHGDAMTGCFWAPEIHVIGGELSILFMPSYDGEDGRTDMWTGRASIIQLGRDADGAHLDPTDPASWSAARHVTRADGSVLNDRAGISLDMTYLEDAGTHYYAWQMLGSIFIATFDPADPARLTSEPVRILAPEYAWDNTIAEGPNMIIRDGRVFMLYSGSTVGDTYTTGLATAASGSDLTDPAAWTRLNAPIQKSGPYNGEYQLGTGHGMWSVDEDGNDLYVFHARTDHLGLTGRDTFVRRVHWTADGLPRLDMETEEELAPRFREVAARVVVGDGDV